MRHKVTVVGAGNVGATCAQELARRDYADVVLGPPSAGSPCASSSPRTGSRRWSSARRRAAASSSTCSAPPPGTRPARPLRRWSTRSSSTRSASSCTAYLEGEYGIDGLYIGVPGVLGSKGIERVVELDLDDAEQQALKASADAVREVVSVLTT